MRKMINYGEVLEQVGGCEEVWGSVGGGVGKVSSECRGGEGRCEGCGEV